MSLETCYRYHFPDGRTKNIHIRGKTKTELAEKRAKLRQQERDGIDLATSSKFGVWADRWLNNVVLDKGLRKATEVQYRSSVNHLKRRFENTEFRYISVNSFQEFLNDLAVENPNTGKPASKSTLIHIRNAARAIALYADGSHCPGVTSFYKCVIPRDAPTKTRYAISEEQVEWIQEFQHPAQPIAMTLTFSGLRRGECLALQWRNIDLDNGTIRVEQEIVFDTGDDNTPRLVPGGKTKNAVRTVAIPPVLVDFLKRYRKSFEVFPAPAQIVFPDRSGRHYTKSEFRRLWDNYMFALNRQYGDFSNVDISKKKDRDLPRKIEFFTTHQARHFFATLCFLEGLTVGESMQQLGHGDPTVTLGRYTDLANYHKPELSDDFRKKLSTDYKISLSAS